MVEKIYQRVAKEGGEKKKITEEERGRGAKFGSRALGYEETASVQSGEREIGGTLKYRKEKGQTYLQGKYGSGKDYRLSPNSRKMPGKKKSRDGGSKESEDGVRGGGKPRFCTKNVSRHVMSPMHS